MVLLAVTSGTAIMLRYLPGILLLTLPILLATLACDSYERPISMSNRLSQTVTVRVFGHLGEVARVATRVDPILRDSVVLSPGEEAPILIDRVGPVPQYTIAIAGEEGLEMFRRTLTRKELDQRKWRLAITEQGID